MIQPTTLDLEGFRPVGQRQKNCLSWQPNRENLGNKKLASTLGQYERDPKIKY